MLLMFSVTDIFLNTIFTKATHYTLFIVKTKKYTAQIVGTRGAGLHAY